MGLIGAPTYPMLRDATQKAFFEVLEAEGIKKEFNVQANCLRLPHNNSTILFRPLSEFERLRGTNLAWFGVDELTYCKEEAWLRLEGRLREPRANRLTGFATWTPKGFDWVYRKFVTSQDPNYSLTRAVPRENVHIPAGFYEGLKSSYDEKFYRQEIEGEYLNIAGGQAYYAFDRRVNVIPSEYDPHWPLFWSLDFNLSPMCSVIGQISDITSPMDRRLGKQRRQVRVIEEICLQASNVYEAADKFIERVSNWVGPYGATQVAVYGDPAGNARSSADHASRSTWQIIREKLASHSALRPAYKVGNSAPAVKDRIAAMNAALRNVHGETVLLIDPKCKNLIDDLEQVVWKSDLNGNLQAQLDKSDMKRTHVSDALGYMIESEFGLRGRANYGTGMIV